MRRPYVYELIDKQTGMWYVGSQNGRYARPENLGTNYFSCSRLVEPLFRAEPERFEKRILLVGPQDYVVEMEAAILRQRDARNDPRSYNMANGDAKFNPVKAAQSTVTLRVGVHNRTKEARVADARKGGLLGGKLTKSRGKGIFARSTEEMRAAGRHCGLTQNIEIKRANGRKMGQRAKEEGLGFCGMTTEQRRLNGQKAARTHKINGTGFNAFSSEQLREFGKKSQSVKARCLECDLVSTRCGLAAHQKSSKHVGREIVDV